MTFGTQSAATTIKIVNNISGAAGGFYPSSVTVNSDTDYTLAANSASVDRISGPATLYKDGTGTLTISMSNDYSGTTTIHAGVIKLGNTGALGSGTLVIQNGGTMDLNHQAIGGKAITVQGAGVNSLGAIVDNSTSTYSGNSSDISFVTLTGDTTFGGVASTASNPGLPANTGGRIMYYNAGGTCNFSTGGNAYNLTKTGNNLLLFVDTTVDPALANVTINEGILGLQGLTTGLGNPQTPSPSTAPAGPARPQAARSCNSTI